MRGPSIRYNAFNVRCILESLMLREAWDWGEHEELVGSGKRILQSRGQLRPSVEGEAHIVLLHRRMLSMEITAKFYRFCFALYHDCDR